MLTILIPTYNRKQKLNRTLDALERQSNMNFNIIISDNNSDYDIKEVIDNRCVNFKMKIIIYKRKENIGQDGNIINLFTLCQTQYAWLISDDDLIYLNAVNLIYDYIEKIPNIGVYCFNLYDYSRFYEHEKIYTSLGELITDLYSALEYIDSRGEFIFLSNKVYNMKLMGKYVCYAFEYISTHIAACLPILKMLEDNVPYCAINKRIVDYEDNGICWSLKAVSLGARTVPDIPLNLDVNQWKKFMNFIMFPFRVVFSDFIDLGKNYKHDPRYLEQLYYGIYIYYLPIYKRLQIRAIIMLTKSENGFVTFRKIYWVLKKIKRMVIGKFKYKRYNKSNPTKENARKR